MNKIYLINCVLCFVYKLWYPIFTFTNQDLINTFAVFPLLPIIKSLEMNEFTLDQRMFTFEILIHVAKLFSGKVVPVFTNSI